MILAKVRLIDGRSGHVRVGLSFPTGFDPEHVIQESVRANGSVAPESVRYEPRRGNFSDLYREFEVSFPAQPLSEGTEPDGRVHITGRFRGGLKFTAMLSGLGEHPPVKA